MRKDGSEILNLEYFAHKVSETPTEKNMGFIFIQYEQKIDVFRSTGNFGGAFGTWLCFKCGSSDGTFVSKLETKTI